MALGTCGVWTRPLRAKWNLGSAQPGLMTTCPFCGQCKGTQATNFKASHSVPVREEEPVSMSTFSSKHWLLDSFDQNRRHRHTKLKRKPMKPVFILIT